jgi:CRISPR-associated protein Cas8a1/Csx13
MVEHADWDLEAHELFIKACHEALSIIYAKLYSRASEEDFVQIEKEKERIRIGLMRCQSYKAFRHFMASFLTKAGSNSVYVNHEQKLTPLVTHPKNWELSRDLALLALVSYKSKKQKEAEAEAERVEGAEEAEEENINY